MNGIFPYFHNALIVKGLTMQGHIVVNHAIMPGSVITRKAIDYKVKALIKIDGWGKAYLKVKRCDKIPISSVDVENLKEKEIVKITASPAYKNKPGYDL